MPVPGTGTHYTVQYTVRSPQRSNTVSKLSPACTVYTTFYCCFRTNPQLTKLVQPQASQGDTLRRARSLHPGFSSLCFARLAVLRSPAILMWRTYAWRLSRHAASALRQIKPLPTTSSPIHTQRRFALRASALGLATGLIQFDPPPGYQSPLPQPGETPTPLCALSEDFVATKPNHIQFQLDSSSVAGQAIERANDIQRSVEKGIESRRNSEDGRAILNVMAINAAVYGLWKVAPANFMVRHFASSLDAMRRRPYTALTANFSHMGALHLSCNMFLLDMFGRDVVGIMSPNRFYVLYIAGGIASVLGSLASRRLLRNNVLSLGASGAVMATMTFYAMLFPDREVYLLGIWKLKCRDALVCWALFDCAGLLGSFGKIDFAAHITGVAFAWLYYNFIREDLSREVLARQKHWGFWGFSAGESSSQWDTYRRQ